ncbi:MULTISPECIES: hypothetical protein [Rhizobium]|uniref:Uncharacterized protein n=1 Tax=Rhizobium favelukesii TaxID=348824 RepID=W6R6H2_9HYPH|nr:MULTISPECIES: hypothetical protein [Rhizobium]MCA0800695.1 hypothetical protein [Rhizobium sp. T1473]MCS0457411.1 hypothetical protein [Rhizobium favelukesii]UFS81800.1 hypothetical protein LPB79_26460 [Rhizobium sp. T136]CDM56544.1 hypothetical protein LPU83_0867 [Rhizobium favelukesii]
MSRVRRIGATRIDLNEFIKRSALAVLSILAVLLPILKVSFTSESDEMVLGDFQLLGGAAYLLPVAFLCGLATVVIDGMRAHARFIDMAGLIIALVAVSRGAYALGSSLMQDVAPVDEPSQRLDQLAQVSLSYGSIPLLLVLFGAFWQLRKSWRN